MNEVKEITKKQLAPSRSAQQGTPPNATKQKGSRKAIISCATIIMAATAIVLGIGSMGACSSAAADSYYATYAAEQNAAYDAQYQKYYNWAEEQYHVKNRVTISLGDLRETANLEVLKVSDTEYIINGPEDNDANITSWLEVPGEGTYIVNLQAAEFIVDDERAYVLVRAPNPSLTNISIDYANVNKLFFKNDFLDDNIRVGEDLARQQLEGADVLIKKELTSNQYFYQSAQDAAVTAIQYLVKQFNPDIPELTVEVEFY